MTLDEFYKKIATEKVDDYLVWIKYKYNHEKQWDYTVEYLQYAGFYDVYEWLNDWHEGQEDVEILGYIAMEDMRHIAAEDLKIMINGRIEMREVRLDNIRNQLITNIFRNPDVIFNVDPAIIDFMVALYEELHMMVIHEHYDYMWHWINKCTGTIQDTTVFDSTGKQVILLKEEMKNGKEKQ